MGGGLVPVLCAEVILPPHDTSHESDGDQDRHKAPTHPLVLPLSLQMAAMVPIIP